MLFQAIRLVHIISGFTAVLLGIASMLAPKKRGLHTTLGSTYHAFMIVICASAAALAVLNWRQSWYFLLISIFSYSYALMGIRAVRKRGPGWLKIHIKGMLGSFIAIMTAVMVTSAAKLPGLAALPRWMDWLLPTLIGIPVIRWAQKQSGAVK